MHCPDKSSCKGMILEKKFHNYFFLNPENYNNLKTLQNCQFDQKLPFWYIYINNCKFMNPNNTKYTTLIDDQIIQNSSFFTCPFHNIEITCLGENTKKNYKGMIFIQ